MDMHKTALERAFDIARAGRCATVSDLVKCLIQEGYSAEQIEGHQIKKQALTLDARGKDIGPNPSDLSVEVLRSAPNDLLRMWPVSTRVNRSGVGDDDPSLIKNEGLQPLAGTV